jgi:hypothetical protein
VEHDIAALFRLPLAAFVEARNELAQALTRAGQADSATRVRALPKPSVSAWVVNQLFWTHRGAFDALLDAGEAFREAQAAQLSGTKSDLRASLDRRREAVSQLLTSARALLTEADHRATPDLLRRVTTSLEALATYGRHGGGPPPGRLIGDAAPPGFEALAALVPQARGTMKPAAPGAVVPFARPARRADRPESAEEERRRLAAARRTSIAEARKALRQATRVADRARRDADTARSAMRSAVAAADARERERAALATQLDDATAVAQAARTKARDEAARAERAAQEIDDAERAVKEARDRLAALDD